jgi:hypothetical protein
MSKIKFLYFENKEGNQVDSIKIYLGNLNINEWLDDVEVKMSIVNGEVEFEILNQEYYDSIELKEIQKELKRINWDGGYEFIDFFNIDDSSNYMLVGDKSSSTFNSINSPQNLKNLKRFKDSFDEEEKTNLELIEESIINQLNLADESLNKEDFERLAESIIDYIDEIGRSKK